MCCGCWKEMGAHRIDNEKVRASQVLIDAVYEHSGAGGNLHIQLDDSNVDDEFFEDAEMKVWDSDNYPEKLAAERACYARFRSMTFEERVSAIGLDEGCWKLGEEIG